MLDLAYILNLLSQFSIYSLIAVSMNMLVGYLGILYLGHPAIYGIGAYTFAILTSQHQFPFIISLLIAGIFSGIMAFLLSLPSLRLKSHYIGMTTLSFLFIMHSLFTNLRGLTRGALGINGIKRPENIFELPDRVTSSALSFFTVTALVSIILLFIIYKILKSPYAQNIEATREDELAMQSIGKNTYKIKMQIFTIVGIVGGIAGGLFASYYRVIVPNSFNVSELILILAMVIVGGIASFRGSLIGAGLMIFINESLRFFTGIPEEAIGPTRYALYGTLIICFMLFKPNGISGRITKIFSK